MVILELLFLMKFFTTLLKVAPPCKIWKGNLVVHGSQINHVEKNNARLRNELAGSAWCILCVSFGGVIA
jgi:hypothetical protein